MPSRIDALEVRRLLVEQVAAVLGVDPARIDGATRFDDDLHADSLDLVEIVENVERRLRARGVPVTLADTELSTLGTVREAARRIAAAVGLPGDERSGDER